MPTPRQYRFLRAQLYATLLGVAGLASVGALTLEHAFLVGFLALVATATLTAPVHVTPPWRRRLRWPLLLGSAVFLALVGARTLEKLLAAL
ncbi:hypothetical protein [Halosimplex carlsbadense]|uniref:hypothetical protein n=1 Tax=Halosimplex carlsbadense TaxID=171164 RepID=UPI000677FAA0|nr:hypothetical protein [Halosimplex carlsbadense]